MQLHNYTNIFIATNYVIILIIRFNKNKYTLSEMHRWLSQNEQFLEIRVPLVFFKWSTIKQLLQFHPSYTDKIFLHQF